ncbi:MAG: Hsp70 family protein [Rhizobiaceae bacterium]
MGKAIGLDFGTSNSTVAILDNGKPRLVSLEGDYGPIPSALFFDFEAGTDHFGRDAIERYTNGHGGRLLRSLKSILGTSLMKESTRVRTRLMPFEEVLGRFIKHVKTTAEAQLGHEVTDVVLGRPVFFVDGDKAADRLAQDTLEKIARAQGFKNIRFQLEPIAAALDYERGLTRERLAMIADIGGGTADFTVAKLVPGKKKSDSLSQVLANGGVHIGGTDVDRVLSVSQVMPLLGLGSKSKDGRRSLPVWPFNDLATWHRINSLSDAKALSQLNEIMKDAASPELFTQLISIVEHREGHRLAGQVEKAKVLLSSEETTAIAFAGIGGGHIPFSRRDFELSIAPLVERLREQCRQTLASAGISHAGGSTSKVDAVFLTGGTTQIPSVQAMLAEEFPDSEFVRGDVFGSVGLGLAIEAERQFAD